MTITPERLERYSDFVDPEHTGAPYDPRQGLERLLGVLSPDPKGIVLAAMDQDWYGTSHQLQSRVFSFLQELGLSSVVWPLTKNASWHYIELKDKNSRQIVDGSLVELGAVVKKIELDPFRSFYQKSLEAELVVPLVQQAVQFVAEARKYAERQKLLGKEPPKFDSMWRLIGAVQSNTDQRRPLAVFDVIDFLVHNPGQHRETDLQIKTQISYDRLDSILPFLDKCGVINYTCPLTENEGQRGKGWSVYTLVNPPSAVDLNPGRVYQAIRKKQSSFYNKTYLAKIVDYIKGHPDGEYEHNILAKKLNIGINHVGEILSLLASVDIHILQKPNTGFNGREAKSVASVNELTFIFYDLVCAPAKTVADTLSPLPLRSWQRQEIAVYLQNYDEERSHRGPQEGEHARNLLLGILSQTEGEMKLSYIADLYNERAEARLKDISIRTQLVNLLALGKVEQSKLGYYRLVKKQV